MPELDTIPNNVETPAEDISGRTSEEVHHVKKVSGQTVRFINVRLIKVELQIINLSNDMQEVKRILSDHTKSIEGLRGEIRNNDNKIDGVKESLENKIDGVKESLENKIDNKFNSLKETFNAKFDSLIRDNAQFKEAFNAKFDSLIRDNAQFKEAFNAKFDSLIRDNANNKDFVKIFIAFGTAILVALIVLIIRQ
jgi:hypothetical protein